MAEPIENLVSYQNFLENSKVIFDARQKMHPVHKKISEKLVVKDLWRETPYSYEKAILECWLGLSERKYHALKLTKADLDNVKTILGWIVNLNKNQVKAEKILGRNIDPLIITDEQNMTKLKGWVEGMNDSYLEDPEALSKVTQVFRVICNQLEACSLLNIHINQLDGEVKKEVESSL